MENEELLKDGYKPLNGSNIDIVIININDVLAEHGLKIKTVNVTVDYRVKELMFKIVKL